MLLGLLVCPAAVFFSTVAPVTSDLVFLCVYCAHLFISSENLLGVD